jgi:hypothetical protein
MSETPQVAEARDKVERAQRLVLVAEFWLEEGKKGGPETDLATRKAELKKAKDEYEAVVGVDNAEYLLESFKKEGQKPETIGHAEKLVADKKAVLEKVRAMSATKGGKGTRRKRRSAKKWTSSATRKRSSMYV